MWTSGATAVLDNDWASTAPSSAPLTNSTIAGAAHCFVWQPGGSVLYTCGRKTITRGISAVATATTASGAYVGDLYPVCRASASNIHNSTRLGMARGMYQIGNIQSGRTIRNASTDLYHAVGASTAGTDDALLLPAVA